MMLAEATGSFFYTWILIPFLIFLARILDVSLGTIRVIFISKGYRIFATLIGFFEILIWLLAIRQIMMNLSNPVCFLAYAVGFSLGTYCGIYIADKLSLGWVMLRVVTQKEADELTRALNQANFGVTVVEARGYRGPVSVLFTVVPRHELRHLINLIKKHNPNAFYTIEDVGSVSEGYFPPARDNFRGNMLKSVRSFRLIKMN